MSWLSRSLGLDESLSRSISQETTLNVMLQTVRSMPEVIEDPIVLAEIEDAIKDLIFGETQIKIDLENDTHRIVWAKFEAEREMDCFLERQPYEQLPISRLRLKQDSQNSKYFKPVWTVIRKES